VRLKGTRADKGNGIAAGSVPAIQTAILFYYYQHRLITLIMPFQFQGSNQSWYSHLLYSLPLLLPSGVKGKDKLN
jgi:hypothetical protein